MKNRTYITIAYIIAICLSGCHDVTVGYLDTSNASYTPDSLVITRLDVTTADSVILNNHIPWQSPTIEGIDGTSPITYRIVKVSGLGVSDRSITQFAIVRKGVIEIAPNHTLPIGEYFIDVEVSNEGYAMILPNIFKVIIE